MFQFKTKASGEGTNPTNINPNTALPNSYGKIRTLKEDYENFKADNLKKAEEAASVQHTVAPEIKAAQTPSPAPQHSGLQPLKSPAAPQAQPKTELRNIPEKPEKKPVPFFQETKTEPQGNALNPFGSQTYFSDKSPFEEKKIDPAEKKATATKPESGSKKTLTVVFSLLLALAIIGGGFYYYWFFIKKNPPQNEVTTPSKEKAPVSQNEIPMESKNLRQLNIDTGLGKEENQKTLRTFSESFLASALENDVIEIKLLDKNKTAIKPKDLETSLGLTLPAGLAENINDDYSFFMKKENSEIRLGAAFKLSATEGLAENLKQQEKTLPLNLAPFYLDKALPMDVISFNSSRYKNADIRYFNFSSPGNTSFDYSVITDKQNSYFIFATSKYSIRSILDYMSEK